MAEDGFAVDDLFPALVEVVGYSRVGGQNRAEAELHVGLVDDFFEDQSFVDFVPLVGETARVEEDDAVAGDAEVFQVGVEGEEPSLPSGLTEIQEAVEPAVDLFRVTQFRKVIVECVFDARGGFGYGEAAQETANVYLCGWKGDDFGD